jgi:hypothetical protein
MVGVVVQPSELSQRGVQRRRRVHEEMIRVMLLTIVMWKLIYLMMPVARLNVECGRRARVRWRRRRDQLLWTQCIHSSRRRNWNGRRRELETCIRRHEASRAGRSTSSIRCLKWAISSRAAGQSGGKHADRVIAGRGAGYGRGREVRPGRGERGVGRVRRSRRRRNRLQSQVVII